MAGVRDILGAGTCVRGVRTVCALALGLGVLMAKAPSRGEEASFTAQNEHLF